MQDFFVMDVFQCKTNLGKPVQNFIFVKILGLSLRISQLVLVFYLRLQITSVAVVHNDAEFSLLGLVDLPKTRDIWVVQNFENLCLSQCLLALFLAHLTNVDLLNDSKHFV